MAAVEDGGGGGGRMTDDELQRRLLGYQSDVPPVTDSTRKILERKLKRFESMAGFSSDDSETERKEPRRFSRRLSNRQTPSPKASSPSFVRPALTPLVRPVNHRASSLHGRTSRAASAPLLLDTSEDDSEDGASAAGRHLAREAAAKTNGHHLTPSTAPNGDSLLDGQFTTTEDLSADNGNGSQLVSMLLVAVVAIFFAVVGSIYLGVLHKDSAVGPPIARSQQVMGLEKDLGIEFEDEDLANLLAAARRARDLLRQRAGEEYCETDDGERETAGLTSEALREALAQDFPLSRVSFSNLVRLFLTRPKWGVRVTTDDGREYRLEATGKVHVSIACRLRRQVRSFFLAHLHLVLGLCCAAVVTGCLYGWTASLKRERDLVFSLVEKILDALRRQHEASLVDPETRPYLAVPHVRDMLIGPADRRKYRDVWKRAARFVENDESRVRLESQIVEGEEFPVWRWVHANPRQASGADKRKTAKVWQGQAFENPDGGMNSLPCSPTPCLKIRSMFDPEAEYGDNWSTTIRDAVLEKCGEGRIVHLKVDTASKEGCVYLKCVDSEAAGVAYRRLHGWWFDGKLVTVKYLRLERYHERFPEAASSHAPIAAP